MRAEGHNTLVLNPSPTPGQDPKAAAKIISFEDKPEQGFAIADLSAAYAAAAQKVSRGVALLNREAVLVQDEIEAEHSPDLWWFMHTSAQVRLDGATATQEFRHVVWPLFALAQIHASKTSTSFSARIWIISA